MANQLGSATAGSGGQGGGNSNSDEDVPGQVFMSWIKDTHETATRESFLRLQELMNRSCDDKQFVLRSERLGVNSAITIARVLDRSPIEKLDLYENVIRDHGIQAISQLLRDSRSLTYLNVGSNDIGPLGSIYLAASLPASRKLAYLVLGSEDGDMHTNKVDCEAAKALADSVSKCKTLKWLDLNHNPIGTDGQEAFHAFARVLERHKTLETLKMGATHMHTSSCIAILRALYSNDVLRSLDIHGNDLQPQVGEILAGLLDHKRSNTNTAQMNTLKLEQNPQLRAKGLSPLFRTLRGDRSLHTLNLSDTGIGDEGAKELALALSDNHSLTHLELAENYITEDGCIAICEALTNNPTSAVAFLNLSSNRLRDDGVSALAHALEENEQLQHIELDSTRISDRGAIALGVALAQNSSVHCLKIGNNHISDEAGRALSELLEKNGVLLTIDIRGNQVSHSTLLRLKKVVQKNKSLKDGHAPNQLQQEVIRLHYQQYKLQEANSELKEHQRARMDLQEQADKTEREAMIEKENTAKRSKEIIERIYMAENTCEDLRSKRKAKEEEDQKNRQTYDSELKILQEKLKVDGQLRTGKQAEWEQTEESFRRLERERQDNLKKMKEKIQEARIDRDNWSAKRKEYRAQAQRSQELIADLEKQIAEIQARRMEADRARKDEQKANRKKKRNNPEADLALIDNLLINQGDQ